MRDRHPVRPARGAVAIEFILIVPLVLLLFWGMFTLSMALLMKFRMANAAWVAARNCTATNAPIPAGATVDCPAVAGMVSGYLGTAAASCSPLNVEGASRVTAGARGYQVKVTCGFSGTYGSNLTLLPKNLELTALAAAPF